jgi:gliding motility-associated-like protein
MKKQYLLFFLLFSIGCFAQFSKIHYIPPLSGTNDVSGSAQEQYLYISTPNVNPVNFRIIQLGGVIINATVSKSIPYVFNAGFGVDTQLMVQKSDVNTILSNKGYIIDADDQIYVSARIIAGNGNQSGALVSKGLAGLGTKFRIGSLLNTNPSLAYGLRHYTFVSILATENNTLVQFSDIKTGVVLINNAIAGNSPSSIVLNSGESFVMAVEGPIDTFVPDQLIPNRDGLIGSLVTSDKPIALNCGSFAGTNADNNLDLGFDQIVSVEKTGKDYIFIKSTGQDPVERVLLVAHTNGTQIRLNGNTGIADYVLNAGEYVGLDGSNFNAQGNLYVQSSENVFAYQTIGDDSRVDFANQELFFVPPLSCETPKLIDNIPLINQIGTRTYSIARITLITVAGATLNFQINGIPYTLAALTSLPGVSINGPITVTTSLGNYDTYVIIGLTGNISVFSSGELYLAAYGTDGAATFGGFYSGFIFKPEITFNLLNVTQNNCIPNATLSVNSLSSFDTFQWYFNGNPIPLATQNFYNPLIAGYYYVNAAIAGCGGNNISSDEIPISSCPIDTDNDLANDNIDIDFDNDGIPNCVESLGDLGIDLTAAASIIITTAGSNTPIPIPFTGASNGNFVTRTPVGKNNSVTFKKTFSTPTNISLEYVNTAAAADLINYNADFVITSDVNKTITVQNPNDQLLIDTNYDNIYESGITLFSSYEIRFRVNGAIPLSPGTGTFRFKSAFATSITLKHINLSDTDPNNATFRLVATCAPKDTDLDGVPDALDLDSDNDGILDQTEAIGTSTLTPTNVDLNLDGLDDAFGIGLVPADNDNDGVSNNLDLDSDNDGIFDLLESGNGATDSNLDGRIDGVPASFGSNGLFNAFETFPNSGILNYIVRDSNADGTANYLSLESDGDGCNDVLEAGFLDPDGDGILGNALPTVNLNGLVTSTLGYTIPNPNYLTSAPITITSQPSVSPFCAFQNSNIIITTSTTIDSYQWQVFLGGIWTNIVNGANYGQSNTNSLLIIAPPFTFNGLKYRVILQRNGNICTLISSEVTLQLYDIPTINSPITLVQCDNDNNGFTTVNLTQKESEFTTIANRIFTYYKTFNAAEIGNESSFNFINNPLNYFTNSTPIWIRIVDQIHGCFTVAQLNVVVSNTQIISTFNRKFYKCDDFLDSFGNNNSNNNDRDGITNFNFSSASASITAILPPPSSNYRVKYYSNFQDASMEVDAMGNSLEISQNITSPESIYNYRNRLNPNQLQIWVRVENILDNSCYGIGPYVSLFVESLPVANPYNDTNIIQKCDDNQDGIFAFDTSSIEAVILNGQTNVNISYFESNGTPLPSPLPNPFIVNTTKTITVRATNTITFDPNGPCYDEETLQFIVDVLPQAFPVNTSSFTVCDDEDNPILQDGMYGFNTGSIESQILNGQTNMEVHYFDGAGQPILVPTTTPFVTISQNITAIVSNPLNRTCPASIQIPFVVKPIPKIILLGSDLICSDNPDFTITIDAAIVDGSSITNYTYQWYLNGIPIVGGTNYSLEINTEGVYTVDVTTNRGCLLTRIIDVIASEIAQIQEINITDLVENNTVEIIATGNGDLVYSIDDLSDFQYSNVFYNVPYGIHQVYVKDINGCGLVGPVEIYVLGIPRFFTPDGDDVNDTWNLKGSSSNYNKNAQIEIFDRHGKFIHQQFGDGKGWDGKLNGKQLPSDDYWYVIKLEDQRVFKGHFSLKR